ncbi:CRISPR-associated endonuclease Cas2 [Cloacibacillus evryensis]|uniref:CRISPR-associated endoribonuclease Cas2 n=1 Tax=bioreactor metagenome TaxID=1076179 RepID=A0A645JHK2_9ZZZZ|nr:CRISPR-associated endonuclease Cas2 [Cloacibacillus evryensis]EXG78632.1 CRISPR-associated endoribonuclease Cas2 [Cloacibacillus evryensis DSM 19522]MCQ4764516.1 CRISPR-associated endonuclease Cas2 [Cloacibacillus evryensis]
MFVIMFYDVGEKRVNKVLKTARKYLTWIQNSVLEGELTPATLEALKVDVKNIIDNEYDSVLFYVWRTERYMTRDTIGIKRGSVDSFI